MNETELLWHTDGHRIRLRLNKTDVEIIETTCPNGNSGECWNPRAGCVVQFFIARYGFECNVGVCPVEELLEICWSISGDQNDPEASQLWLVPMNDEAFHAWLVSKNVQSNE